MCSCLLLHVPCFPLCCITVQVVLSMQLSFAVLPLVHFTSSAKFAGLLCRTCVAT